LHLSVRLDKPDKLLLKAYASASIDRLTLNAGDPDAQLSGLAWMKWPRLN